MGVERSRGPFGLMAAPLECSREPRSRPLARPRPLVVGEEFLAGARALPREPESRAAGPQPRTPFDNKQSRRLTFIVKIRTIAIRGRRAESSGHSSRSAPLVRHFHDLSSRRTASRIAGLGARRSSASQLCERSPAPHAPQAEGHQSAGLRPSWHCFTGSRPISRRGAATSAASIGSALESGSGSHFGCICIHSHVPRLRTLSSPDFMSFAPSVCKIHRLAWILERVGVKIWAEPRFTPTRTFGMLAKGWPRFIVAGGREPVKPSRESHLMMRARERSDLKCRLRDCQSRPSCASPTVDKHTRGGGECLHNTQRSSRLQLSRHRADPLQEMRENAIGSVGPADRLFARLFGRAAQRAKDARPVRLFVRSFVCLFVSLAIHLMTMMIGRHCDSMAIALDSNPDSSALATEPTRTHGQRHTFDFICILKLFTFDSRIEKCLPFKEDGLTPLGVIIIIILTFK